MKHSVTHNLGLETARKVARAALQTYAERFPDFSPTSSWPTDDKATIGFSAKGMSVTGSVEVKPSSFDINLDVPFLLKPFQSKALEVIEREISKWIGKAQSGELK